MKINYNFYKGFVIFIFIVFARPAFSQNVGISSSSGFTPDASAALDVNYSSKGLLIPRVLLTATNAVGPITSPAISLLVYNTATAGTAPNNVTPGYYYWNGVAWAMLSTTAQTASSVWNLTGNTGTTAGTNFIGTTDATDFVFKTSNTERARITSAGNFAIGSTAFSTTNPERLLVDAGASSFNVISGKGNLNSYLQLNIQNNNAGTGASSDVVATSDNGNETINYVDMGINSSVNNANNFGGANDAYLYNAGNTSSTAGGNFYIGTSTSGKNLGFLTGGNLVGVPATPTTSANPNNERMRIDGTGNVGINNIAPTEKLDITGNLKFSGALMPNNNAGTAGYILQSAGAGAPPVWASPSANQNWSLTGNAGTTAGTNFIGTTDAVDFTVKTTNAERLRVSAAGDVAIGGTAFNASNSEQLLVDAGTTSSTNVISGKGSINNFLQLNIQNFSTGNNASSDVVATADNGTDAVNYIDMGINGSGNTKGFYYGVANDAYIYNAGGSVGGNLYIGNSTANKFMAFLTGGYAATNERMRIDGAGNIGMGTTAPTRKLDVNGTIVSSTNTYPNYAFNAANRISFGENNVPPNETGSVTQFGSGSTTRNMVFAFSKSGINTSFLGNDGTQMMIGSEGTANPITFRTGLDYSATNIIASGTEAMRITGAGNVGIGTNSPGQKLTVAGNAVASADNSYSLGLSGTRWSNLYATTLNFSNSIQSSDRRLKTNIKPLKYGLKEVLELKPVSYNWKDRSQPQNKIGFIAQDVRKIIPEVVSGDEKKEKLGMNYAELVSVLVNAVQEQQKQIDELKKQVQKLQK